MKNPLSGFTAVALLLSGGIARAERPIVPQMIRIAAGSFVAGSPKAETDAVHYPAAKAAHEQPQRAVAIVRPFAIARTEVTRAAFARFVADTGWRPDGPCSFLADTPGAAWASDAEHDWRKPGFRQTDRHPVVCVNLADATAYAAWLSRKTGRAFRLPSGDEWEYAARAGTTDALPWRGSICRYANIGDLSRTRRSNAAPKPGVPDPAPDPAAVMPCDDGHVATAPVASYRPNPWGLYDMIGNVWEWTSDCDGDRCASHVDRGASWGNTPKYVRAATRHPDLIGARTSVLGIRLVEDVR